MKETPYLKELVRRMRLEVPSVDIRVGARSAASIARCDARVDHPLTLLVSERDLAAAVTALGEDCRDALWPGSSIEEANFSLLPVHPDEIVTRNTAESLHVTSQGLEWPS